MDIDTSFLGALAGSGASGSLLLFFIKRSISKVDDNASRIRDLERTEAIHQENIKTLQKDLTAAHGKIRALESINKSF